MWNYPGIRVFLSFPERIFRHYLFLLFAGKADNNPLISQWVRLILQSWRSEFMFKCIALSIEKDFDQVSCIYQCFCNIYRVARGSMVPRYLEWHHMAKSDCFPHLHMSPFKKKWRRCAWQFVISNSLLKVMWGTWHQILM